MVEKLKQIVTKDDMLNDLKWYRDGVDGNIPEDIVHNGLYKVRTNWFFGLQARLKKMIKKGYIPSEFIADVQEFIAKVKNKGERLTTQEDIKGADSLISKILGDKNE